MNRTRRKGVHVEVEIKSNKSTILLGYFSDYVGNDDGVWKGVIGRHGDADVNDNGRLLLQLCCNNALYYEHFLPAQRCAQVHLLQIFLGSTVAH